MPTRPREILFMRKRLGTGRPEISASPSDYNDSPKKNTSLPARVFVVVRNTCAKRLFPSALLGNWSDRDLECRTATDGSSVGMPSALSKTQNSASTICWCTQEKYILGLNKAHCSLEWWAIMTERSGAALRLSTTTARGNRSAWGHMFKRVL